MEDAFKEHGPPKENLQFRSGEPVTSDAFIATPEMRDAAISMDSPGRAIENFYIEHFWRSLTYEWLYLHSFDNVFSMKGSLAENFDEYNKRRLHEAIGYRTLDECCTSAPCVADFNFGLLSRSPADMRLRLRSQMPA